MVKEKPGFLTAKAISNRIKSKGLQKLRWFCQMCQKQCRDENGFKCHITSESHHRQMLLFEENANHFLGNYTRVFMKGYLDVLRRQFGGKRTQANVVYQEYIKDKEHVHMNSTKFTTLTGFINCLHKMGICRVDQTDKGWFIEYVAKDPEQEHQDKKKRRLDRTLAEDDEMFFEQIEKHLSKRQKLGDKEEKENESEGPMELVKDESEKIAFNFIKSDSKKPLGVDFKEEEKKESEIKSEKGLIHRKIINNEFESMEKIGKFDSEQLSIFIEEERKKSEIKDGSSEKMDLKQSTSFTKEERKIDRNRKRESGEKEKKLSTLEEMKREQEREKERKNRLPYWLHEGILVRLVDGDLPEGLRKKLARVIEVEDRYGAVVKTVDAEGGANKKLRVKQQHVLTVVPKVGERVLLVNGAYRGCRGVLRALDKRQFTADIELASGIHTGMRLSAIVYDDFSKLYDQS